MLYLQKGNFQKAVRWLAGSWMTANQATFLGIIFIILTSLSLYAGFSSGKLRQVLLVVPVFLFLRLAMNTLDGMLSREYKTATVGGEILNESLDVVGDTICYGVLYFVPGFPRAIVALFILLIWAAEYFGILGKSMPGGSRRHETIGGGKPDRAVWVGLLCIILYFNPQFLSYVKYYLLGVCALVFLTCIIRIKKIIELSKGKEYESYTWIGK